MSKRDMKQWMEQAIRQKERLAIPIMTHPGIDLCGKTVKQAVTDGGVHAEAICRLNAKYPSAAATVIMDLTVEAEAFGAAVIFPEHEIPTVTGSLLANEEDIKKLAVPGLDAGRIQEYLKANRLAAGHITDRPVLGGCIGPYSLAGRLYDMSEMMMLIYLNPDVAGLLLEKCTTFILSYCKAIKDVGANGIIMAEPAAGLLPNDECAAFSSAFIKRIVDEVQDDSFIFILHNCGNTGHCTQAMTTTGAWGYHFGNRIDMEEAMAAIPAGALGMGNIDPVSVLKMLPAAGVEDCTLQLLHAVSRYPNFVLSSGCDIPPHVPMENIEAFYRALDRYNTGEEGF